MLDYLFSMVAGFWIGMSALIYIIFYWIEEVWDLPVTKTESASSAHSRLQQLVQRVIEEALHLPAFLDYSGVDRDSQGRLPEFSPSTYEDLLATAILNKVIDRYQQDLKRSTGASSSGVHSGSSSPDGGEGSGPAGRRRGRARPRGRDSSPEQSSLEPASQDDYALSDSSGRATDRAAVKEVRSLHNSDSSTDDEGPFTTSYSNPVDGALSNINFQNKARVVFPEYGGDIVEKNGISLVSKEYAEESNHNESNDGLNQNSDIYANNNSWEENWLFQKKRMKTAQPVPVPMLIPNSNTEYRALIGDRDAEDTTDLSEAGSETEDTTTDIKQMLVNSKTIIGGKNPELVLTLIDQDINENEVPLESTFTVDSSPDITVIEMIHPAKNSEIVGKDENDNQRVTDFINIKTDEPQENDNPDIQLISLTVDAGDNYIDVPKTKNKDDMRDYLKNLESDDDGDVKSRNGGFEFVSRTHSRNAHDVFINENVTEATNFDVVDKKEEENLDSLNGHQQESEYIETIAKPVQRHMDSLKRQHYKPVESEKNSDNEEEPPPPLPTSKLPNPAMVKTEEEIIAIVANSEKKNLYSLNGHQQESEYIGTITKPVQRHMNSLKIQHFMLVESEKNSDNEEEPSPPLPTSKTPDPAMVKTEEEIFAIVAIPEEENLDSLDGHQQESEHIGTIAKPIQLKRQPYKPIESEKNNDKEEELSQLFPTSKTPDPAMVKTEEEIFAMVAIPVSSAKTEDIVESVNKDVDENNEMHLSFIKDSSSQIEDIVESVNKDIDENDDIQFTMNGKPYKSDPEEKHDKDEDDSHNNNSPDYTEKETPGSIAEREHKKWLNAVPMENNPYSPEAIERRLNKQSNNSLYDMVAKTNPESKQPEKTPIGVPLQVALSEGGSDFKRYGRDYYINASKKATGARKRLLNMKFDSLPDESPDVEETRPKTMIRSTSEATTPSWDYIQENYMHEDATLLESPKIIIKREVVEYQSEIYAATPVIVEDVDTQFDNLYEKAFKYEDDSHFASSIDLNVESTQKLLELTNGVIVNNDFLDQSDSISSQDDSPRVYNIKSGKITSTKDKLHNETQEKHAKMNVNTDDKDAHLLPSLASNAKSWKSMGDVYWDTDEDKYSAKVPESKIEEDLDLPSVRDLRKKFFTQKQEDVPFIKPKRKISKDLLDNKIMTKSFSNSQSNLKQPQHMHSITARSVSKEFREELKLSMPAHAIIHPGGSKNLPDGSEDPAKEGKSDSRPESPVPEPGSLRNKLAFFEQLNKH